MAIMTEKYIVSADGKRLPFTDYKTYNAGKIHDGNVLEFELANKYNGTVFQPLSYSEIKEFIQSDLSKIEIWAEMETAPAGYAANKYCRKLGEFIGYSKDPVLIDNSGSMTVYRLILREEKVADVMAAQEMQELNDMYEAIAEVYETML